MRYTKSKAEFLALATFLCGVALVLTNGFSARIFAQEEEDYFAKIEPIGEVLGEIMKNYVYEPDLDRAVEGALQGIMRTLDRNSSFISAAHFRQMQEDTEGEFEGIGIRIRADESGRIVVWSPIPGAPAAKAGMRAGDIIYKIEGVDVIEKAMDTAEVARRIKGPRGQIVHLTILRPSDDGSTLEEVEFDIRRGRIPLESVAEARLLDDGIGYIRITDFKKNTARDVRKRLEEFMDAGMKSFVLDLRWNPGGLLTSAPEVCDLFLDKNLLVTSTQGRDRGDGSHNDEMRLYTRRKPLVPETMPIMLLVNGTSASSSEIVTGALQYYSRAIVIGEKTFGKGSVQTITPLRRPKNSALRLTTALYFTPADVTINNNGILPDVEVEMDPEAQRALISQLYASYENDPSLEHQQNHGSVSGNTVEDDTVEDLVLARAVEILKEDTVFENLIAKYHKDTSETQVAASEAAPESDGS